ncbi:MAG: response regulator [Verrucomicrobiales bacterium]|nr:response regulator [Verrucomicrobiales bacterium]
MKSKEPGSSRSNRLDGLRAQAARRVQGRQPGSGSELSAEEALTELQIHQAELEIQNEELRESHERLELARGRYFALFDLAPIPYLVFGPDHRVIELNLAAADLLDRPRQTSTPNAFALHLIPSERERFHGHLTQVFTSGRRSVVELGFGTSDQASRDLHLESQLLHATPDGDKVCLTAIIDLTERKRMERALRQSESRQRAILAALPDRVLLLTRQGHVVPFDVSGPDGALRVGGNLEEVLPAPLSEVVRRGLGRLAYDGAGSFAEEIAVRDTHGTRHFEVRMVSGGSAEMLVLIRDCTQRVELEARVRQSQKLQAIGQLAGGVAHDFNNILSIIKLNAARILEDDTEMSRIRSSATSILSETDKAAHLARQMLAFARRQPMETRAVEIVEVLQSMATLLARVLGEAIQVHHCSTASSVHVLADRVLLEQVIMNLGLNARDAMPSGGVLILAASRVSVASPPPSAPTGAKAGDYVMITVTDTGVGIAPEHLPRIFEPFFTTKEVGKGTGLGLATAFGIIHQHRGWIELTSTVGIGTAFRIHLPIAVAEAPPAAPLRPPMREGRERLLVVEDLAPLRELMVRLLSKVGHTVETADCGAAALARWPDLRDRIDLVITDVNMPGGVSGYALAQKLREDRPDLRFLFVSGFTQESPPAPFDRDGSQFLPKPFAPEILTAAIGACAERRGAARNPQVAV